MKPVTTVWIDDQEVPLPTQWEICGNCRGNGSVSRIPGAITGDQLDEWYGDSEERYEFIEEYTRPGGMYDKPCDDCEGSGKVKVVDESALDQKILEIYHEHEQEVWDTYQTEMAERRAGA